MPRRRPISSRDCFRNAAALCLAGVLVFAGDSNFCAKLPGLTIRIGFLGGLWLARMMNATIQSTAQPAKTTRATGPALTAIAVLTAMMERATTGLETVTPEAAGQASGALLRAWVSSWGSTGVRQL